MKNRFDLVYRHQSTLFKGLLYAASIAIIVFFFPKGGQFKYEFQQGKPWQHQTLYCASAMIARMKICLTVCPRLEKEGSLPALWVRNRQRHRFMLMTPVRWWPRWTSWPWTRLRRQVYRRSYRDGERGAPPPQLFRVRASAAVNAASVWKRLSGS